MKKILIIGGTGMLRKVSEYFIEANHEVTIIARNLSRLEHLKNKYKEKEDSIQIISADYANEILFLESIHSLLKSNDFDIALLWIHSFADSCKNQLIEILYHKNSLIQIYDVKGSAYYHPQSLLKYNDKCYSIYLGYQKENDTSRWLTHNEISAGTIYAITHELKEYIIGQVSPWEERP